MTLTWLCLATGLLLSGQSSGRRADALRGRTSTRSGGARLPARAQAPIAAAAAVVVSVTMLGIVAGTVAAVVVAPLAALAVRRLAARVSRPPAGPELALTLDLVAVALRAGRPVADALQLAAPAAVARAPTLRRVAGLLRLGADPDDAWREAATDPQLAPVAAAARRSAASGTRLAAAFEQEAAQVRAGLRASAEARAHRAGVLAAAPLGLCFLPSFVCLGIVPLVIAVAAGALQK